MATSERGWLPGPEPMYLSGVANACLAFSPDGRLVAVGGNDIELWELATGQRRRVLRGHEAIITSLPALTRAVEENAGTRITSGAPARSSASAGPDLVEEQS